MLELPSNVAEFEGFRWRVGGKTQFLGLNGIFHRLFFKAGPGGHIDSIDQFTQFVKTQEPRPPGIAQIIPYPQQSDVDNFQVGVGAESYTTIGGGDYPFADEYAVSGWFKFMGTP